VKIKYWDFKREYIKNKKNYLKEIDKTLLSKSLILGDQVKSFEKNISKYIGFKYGVGVNSGTDALIISLMSIGIKRGDQMITTSNTAIPTISAM
jgi:Predicted pyridoxal phosphate-dependent enzyme apparently involved in regulation of cell wall biogenesis